MLKKIILILVCFCATILVFAYNEEILTTEPYNLLQFYNSINVPDNSQMFYPINPKEREIYLDNDYQFKEESNDQTVFHAQIGRLNTVSIGYIDFEIDALGSSFSYDLIMDEDPSISDYQPFLTSVYDDFNSNINQTNLESLIIDFINEQNTIGSPANNMISCNHNSNTHTQYIIEDSNNNASVTIEKYTGSHKGSSIEYINKFTPLLEADLCAEIMGYSTNAIDNITREYTIEYDGERLSNTEDFVLYRGLKYSFSFNNDTDNSTEFFAYNNFKSDIVTLQVTVDNSADNDDSDFMYHETEHFEVTTFSNELQPGGIYEDNEELIGHIYELFPDQEQYDEVAVYVDGFGMFEEKRDLIEIAQNLELFENQLSEKKVYILIPHNTYIDMRLNALFVTKSLTKIYDIEENKLNGNKLELIGYSQGGLLSRFALSWAEHQGFQHFCNELTLIDTPNRGVYFDDNLITTLSQMRSWFISYRGDIIDAFPTILGWSPPKISRKVKKMFAPKLEQINEIDDLLDTDAFAQMIRNHPDHEQLNEPYEIDKAASFFFSYLNQFEYNYYVNNWTNNHPGILNPDLRDINNNVIEVNPRPGYPYFQNNIVVNSISLSNNISHNIVPSDEVLRLYSQFKVHYDWKPHSDARTRYLLDNVTGLDLPNSSSFENNNGLILYPGDYSCISGSSIRLSAASLNNDEGWKSSGPYEYREVTEFDMNAFATMIPTFSSLDAQYSFNSINDISSMSENRIINTPFDLIYNLNTYETSSHIDLEAVSNMYDALNTELNFSIQGAVINYETGDNVQLTLTPSTNYTDGDYNVYKSNLDNRGDIPITINNDIYNVTFSSNYKSYDLLVECDSRPDRRFRNVLTQDQTSNTVNVIKITTQITCGSGMEFYDLEEVFEYAQLLYDTDSEVFADEFIVSVNSDLLTQQNLSLSCYSSSIIPIIKIYGGNKSYSEVDLNVVNANVEFNNFKFDQTDSMLKLALGGETTLNINNSSFNGIESNGRYNAPISMTGESLDPLYHQVDILIEDCTFENNNGSINPYADGANPWWDHTVSIDEYSDYLSKDYCGGVIYIDAPKTLYSDATPETNLFIRSSTFDDNTAIVGSTIFANNLNLLSVENSKFENNSNSFVYYTSISTSVPCGSLIQIHNSEAVFNRNLFNDNWDINSVDYRHDMIIIADESQLDSNNNTYRNTSKDMVFLAKSSDSIVNSTNDIFYIDNHFQYRYARSVNIENSIAFGHATSENPFSDCSFNITDLVNYDISADEDDDFLLNPMLDNNLNPVWDRKTKSPAIDAVGNVNSNNNDIGAKQYTGNQSHIHELEANNQWNWVSFPYLWVNELSYNDDYSTWQYVFDDFMGNDLFNNNNSVVGILEISSITNNENIVYNPDFTNLESKKVYSQYGYKIKLRQGEGIPRIQSSGFAPGGNMNTGQFVTDSDGNSFWTNELYISKPFVDDICYPDPNLPNSNSNLIRPIYLGYWLDEKQSVRTLLDPIWDDIVYIKHKKWSYDRIPVLGSQKSQNDYTIHWMGPGLEETQISPEYQLVYPGEMIEVGYTGSDDISFMWANPQQPPTPPSYIIETPVYFGQPVDPTPGYVPIYVNIFLDEYEDGNKPVEIAIYVDGICKGSSVIKEDQVQLLAFVTDEKLKEQLADIQFHLYFPSAKNCPEQIASYTIFNRDLEDYVQASSTTEHFGSYLQVKINSGEEVPMLPENLTLSKNYPNPFNPTTNISFALPNDEKVKLEVYNIKGQKVKVLVNDNLKAGDHNVVWNGKNTNNRKVASGVYFYRLTTSKKQLTHKMIMMK